jgi:hypothetical protein
MTRSNAVFAKARGKGAPGSDATSKFKIAWLDSEAQTRTSRTSRPHCSGDDRLIV